MTCAPITPDDDRGEVLSYSVPLSPSAHASAAAHAANAPIHEARAQEYRDRLLLRANDIGQQIIQLSGELQYLCKDHVDTAADHMCVVREGVRELLFLINAERECVS